MVIPLLLYPGQVIAQSKVHSSLPPLTSSVTPVSKVGTLLYFVEIPEKPDFDKEVLIPLRKAQAEKAAAEAEARQKAREAAQREEAQKQALVQAEAQNALKQAQTVQTASPIQSDLTGIIVHWAEVYGISPALLLRIASCESGVNTHAQNPSGATGLFQHMSQYWPARAAKYGFPGASIYDPNAQAAITAAMFKEGLSYMWVCK